MQNFWENDTQNEGCSSGFLTPKEFSSTMLQNGGWKNKQRSTVKKKDLYMAESLEKLGFGFHHFSCYLSIQPHTNVSSSCKLVLGSLEASIWLCYCCHHYWCRCVHRIIKWQNRMGNPQNGFDEHSLEKSGPALSTVSCSEEQIELFKRTCAW